MYAQIGTSKMRKEQIFSQFGFLFSDPPGGILQHILDHDLSKNWRIFKIIEWSNVILIQNIQMCI